jgi:hypothetical protein
MNENKNFADKTARAARETLEKGTAAALWSSHTKKQFETLTEQSKELTALAQRIATSSAEPMTRALNALKGTT